MRPWLKVCVFLLIILDVKDVDAVLGQQCYTVTNGDTANLECLTGEVDPDSYGSYFELIKSDPALLDLHCRAQLLNENYALPAVLREHVQKFQPVSLEVKALLVENCHQSKDNLRKLLIDLRLNLSSVETVRFNNNLKDAKFSGGVLESLPNLRNIIVRGGLEHLSRDTLGKLKRLEDLDVYGNLISNTSTVFSDLQELRYLQLGSNRLEILDATSFEGLSSLVRLNLEDNKLRVIGPDTFKPLRDLQILGLASNDLARLPVEVFASNTKLVQLSLAKNLLSSLPVELFSNLTALTALSLRENAGLTELPDDLLAGTTNLRVLDISGCQLKRLPAGLFRNLGQLTKLDLSNNAIDSLTADNFRGLSRLSQLKLGHNRLTEIGESVFAGLGSLSILQLNNNKLTSVKSAAFTSCTVEEIDLSFNALTFVDDRFPFGYEQSPLNPCQRLRVINLSHNNISDMFEDWMLIMSNLTRLDLAHNQFTSLSFNSLTFLVSGDIQVDLRSNQIGSFSALDAQWVDTNKRNNKTLLLEDNPLNCDCLTFHLAKYMNRSLDGAAHSWNIDGAICRKPSNLAGKSVDIVDPMDFVCHTESVQAGCPSKCTCTQRPADRTVLANCQETPDDLVRYASYSLQLNFNGTRQKLASLVHSKTTHDHVIVLNLSNSGTTAEDLDFDWSALDVTFPNLAQLMLNSNAIRYIPFNATRAWNSSRIKLALGDNPYVCGCENRNLHEFVNLNRDRLLDMNAVLCDGRSFIDLRIDEICPYLEAGILAATVIILFVLLLVFVAAFVLWRLRRTIRAWMYASGWCLQWVIQSEDDEDEDKPYDAFVSFSHKDEDFVLQTLVPALEEPSDGSPRYRLCLHYRDWLAGEWIPDQIARSVASSKRTIVVLSPHFLESVWGQLEFRTAYDQVLKDKRNRLIVVVSGALPSKESMDHDLKTYLSLNTYLKWGDPWFWERLRYALPHKKDQRSNMTKVYLDNNPHDMNGHKEASSLNKGLAPLPLTRSSVKVEIVVPPEMELNLTPTSSVGSGDPIFPVAK